MRYMLDTCTIIFAATDTEYLSDDIVSIMSDYDNTFCVSMESIREMILKYRLKHTWNKTCKSAKDIYRSVNEELGIQVLSIHEPTMNVFATLELKQSPEFPGLCFILDLFP